MSGGRARGPGRRTEAAFRLLLRLLPAAFRRTHGAAMEATFRERLEGAGSAPARLGLLLAEAADVGWTAFRLRAAAAAHWGDDLRYALRSLVRNPTHTLFAGLTLALGIGATTAIFSALDSVLLRPLDYPDPDRVVMAWRSRNEGSFIIMPSSEQARALAAMEGVFEAVEPFTGRQRTLTGRGAAARLETVHVRPSFEIGIRMSLGAARRGIFGMVLRQGVATTLLGVTVGVALAALGARLLSAGLFGVEPADPAVWGGAATLLLAVALVATWLPARRAARVDPVEAMRSE